MISRRGGTHIGYSFFFFSKPKVCRTDQLSLIWSESVLEPRSASSSSRNLNPKRSRSFRSSRVTKFPDKTMANLLSTNTWSRELVRHRNLEFFRECAARRVEVSIEDQMGMCFLACRIFETLNKTMESRRKWNFVVFQMRYVVDLSPVHQHYWTQLPRNFGRVEFNQFSQEQCVFSRNMSREIARNRENPAKFFPRFPVNFPGIPGKFSRNVSGNWTDFSVLPGISRKSLAIRESGNK